MAKKQFSTRQRQQILKQVRSLGVEETCRRHGISPATVKLWLGKTALPPTTAAAAITGGHPEQAVPPAPKPRAAIGWFKPTSLTILFVILIVLALSWGPCTLVKNLITRFGPAAAFGILLLALSPATLLIATRFFGRRLRLLSKKIEDDPLMTVFFWTVVLFVGDLVLIIIPNLICFVFNLAKSLLAS